ncbi:TonB-dependent receptor [Sphingorhabdus sp. Alg239-R122]|uniref:TonB-dependent receptor n=1 Tax=Sphingorhabdus sp. Alg239-R122 TaxID=2305989 RepID=UPI0013DD5E46|nr:TonB-dependent receptor [Sphingorhabdus sp. Alg239-R122]
MRKWAWTALPLLAMAAPVWGQETDSAPPPAQDDPDFEECTLYVEGCNYSGVSRRLPVEAIRPVTVCYGQDMFEGDGLTHLCEDIVILGEPLARPVSERAFSTSYADVAQVPGFRLENALRDVPGLQQFRRSDARSANPTSQGITLRGLGGNASSRALVMLDGVPQSDPFGGYVSWPGYDALTLSSVRVRRGGGSGAEGSGAIAGTVELLNDGNSEAVSAALAYGSRDSIDADIAIGWKLGAGHLSIGASYQSGNGFVPVIASQRGSVDRPAAYEHAGLAARFVVPLSNDTELQTSVRAFTDARERGFAFSENSNDGADASIRLVNRSSDGWQWSALGYVQIRSLQTSFGGVAAGRNSVRRVFEQFNVPSTGIGARFELRPAVGDDLELRIGGDWRRTSGETKENFFFQNGQPLRNRFAGGRTDTLGGYVEASWQATDRLILTGSGRLDRWWVSGGFRREVNIGGSVRSDAQFTGRSDWEATGRTGFTYEASNAISLRGAAYMGWRLPTLNELFRPFRVGPDATAANENLTPERLRGAEIGADFDLGSVDLGMTLFHNRLDNAIANVTLDSGPGLFPGVGFVSGAGVYRQRQNLNDITSRGLELDATFYLEDMVGLEDADITLGYAYIDAEVRGVGDSAFLTGLRPAQVPRHNASGSFRWDSDMGATFSFTGRYTGSQFDDDGSSRLLDDAFTVDAFAAYDLTDNLALELRGENMLDARVETAISSSGIIERAQPQTFWLGVRVKLD